MATDQAATDLKLHRHTLRYRDPALEAEYLRHAPEALIRTVRPLVIVMLPIVVALGTLEFAGLLDIPTKWTTAAGVAAMLALLLVLARYVPPWTEYGVIASFIATMSMLCADISSSDDLQRAMPGLVMVVLIANFVGIRYLQGLLTSLLMIAMVVTYAFWMRFDTSILVDTGVFLIIGMAVSISMGYTIDRQRRRLYAQLKLLELERDNHEKLALHDALTGLANRLLLRERMGQSLARAKRHHGQFAVLFVDLDDFKTVNDSYGHGVGDEALRQLAANLEDRVRDEDTVARIGGDEFVILSEHVQDDRGARIAADRIQAAVAEPVVARTNRDDTIHIHVTCSIGIALCPRDGDSLDELIDRADSAMYRAKRSGKATTQFFRKDNEDDPGESAASSAQ